MLLVFFLSFFTQALDYVDYPEKCFVSRKFPCSVRAVDSSVKIIQGETVVYLGPQASVLMINANHLKPLEGLMWVQKSEGLSISILGYDLKIQGEWGIEAIGRQVTFQNYRGDMISSSQKILTLPQGFENWLSLLDVNKNVIQGIPKPFNVSDVIKKLKPILKDSKTNIKEWVENKKLIWKINQKQAAEMFKQIVDQTQILQAHSLRKKQQQLEKVQQENKKIKELFRLRALYPESQ